MRISSHEDAISNTRVAKVNERRREGSFYELQVSYVISSHCLQVPCRITSRPCTLYRMPLDLQGAEVPGDIVTTRILRNARAGPDITCREARAADIEETNLGSDEWTTRDNCS